MTTLSAWSDAVIAAQLFAVDPAGTGGLWVRSRAGPVRERWLSILRAALPPATRLHPVPMHIPEGRLLGGLDLSATLQAGWPIAQCGLLSEANGGVLLLKMAERLVSSTTVHVTAAMDAQETRVERDGMSLCLPARFGVVALDEGLDDEFAPASLIDRLAFSLDLNDLPLSETEEFAVDPVEILAAREKLPSVNVGQSQIAALCNAAAALGIASLRMPILALGVARVSAAFAGKSSVDQDDIELAAQLVLAPRALVPPPAEKSEQQPAEPSLAPDSDDYTDPGEKNKEESCNNEQQARDIDRALDEVILAAAQAAIPPGVLAAIRQSQTRGSRARSAGKAGQLQKSNKRGRPAGSKRGELRSSGRLNVIETLRAAAPWQPLRHAEALRTGVTNISRIQIRKDDFRISRFKQRTETTTIFVVDASGSAALHRLAEAKGAVELLLADCYVRRDQVAMIAFRGAVAELLLPPTRSLARAKRSLAGLPGGGGTPLAAALDAAFALADSIRRKGQTPTVILLTDGRANIARDGSAGRPRAEEDALKAARTFRSMQMNAVLVDTSPRPQPFAEKFAVEMGARYLPLPYADAHMLSKAVLASTQNDFTAA